MTYPDNRIRAWLLMRADSDKHKDIRKKLASLDDKETTFFVYIRADQVGAFPNTSNGTYNLIAAIDAEDDSKLKDFTKQVDSLGIEKLDIYVVASDGHSPTPPHSATGYLSEDELRRYSYEKPITVAPGRQDNSPGFNPWG